MSIYFLYVHIHVDSYSYEGVYQHKCMCMYVRACIYVHLHVRICRITNTHIYLCTCMYVLELTCLFMHAYMHVNMYVYMYIMNKMRGNALIIHACICMSLSHHLTITSCYRECCVVHDGLRIMRACACVCMLTCMQTCRNVHPYTRMQPCMIICT